MKSDLTESEFYPFFVVLIEKHAREYRDFLLGAKIERKISFTVALAQILRDRVHAEIDAHYGDKRNSNRDRRNRKCTLFRIEY